MDTAAGGKGGEEREGFFLCVCGGVHVLFIFLSISHFLFQ